MAGTSKNGNNTYRKNQLWIASSSSMKPKAHQSDWRLHRSDPDESNKYLELADIALGLKPVKSKAKRSA